MSFDTALVSVLRSEGGFVNDARDPGGMTCLGVTKHAWDAWKGGSVSEAEMRAFLPSTVAPFYRAMYWNPCHCDSLPPALALVVFHCAVNAGVGRAAKLLQKIVGAAPDGAIGPGTLAAVARHDAKDLVIKFQDALRAFYQSLPTFSTFGKGWFRRASLVQAEAMALL